MPDYSLTQLLNNPDLLNKDNRSNKKGGPVVHLKKDAKLKEPVEVVVPPYDEHRERDYIVNGSYRDQLYQFTYNHRRSIFQSRTQAVQGYTVHPVLNKPGFRCTAAVANKIEGDTVELHINFLGTIDFASLRADVDKEGPGQHLLKKYESDLIKKVNDMILQLSKQHPDKKIRLRVAGHSLGGSLAKGFAHTVQRACVVQQDTLDGAGIISKIEEAGFKPTNPERLRKKLDADRKEFGKLDSLKKLAGVTVYALGSPGVGRITDEDATALTYAHDDNFLRVYHHYHEEDDIRRFGEVEFLSGQWGKPNIKVNRAVSYNGKIEQYRKDRVEGLPFPGIGKTVMAAHIMTIRNEDFKHDQDVSDLLAQKSEEKFHFSPFLWALYEASYMIMSVIAKLAEGKAKEGDFLYSYPVDDELPTPTFVMN
ncbi:hypothetical protein [Legionella erythra]|uniref:Lipase (Class 3) n=1 Tax=Legionella erythra TaxID=448 RepID=A0A0W0TGF4_LEGER|nr:hypothetical protein [Legionella erythra]KTC94654.1 Lipase (class 3) [Legionella erythra]